MTRTRVERIYGKVTGVGSIRDINKKIRSQIRNISKVAAGIGKSKRAALTELVRRSQYIVTLTFSPAWKKSFRGKIRKLRTVAKEEFSKTAHTANVKVKQGKVKGKYYDEKWGRGRRVTV